MKIAFYTLIYHSIVFSAFGSNLLHYLSNMISCNRLRDGSNYLFIDILPIGNLIQRNNTLFMVIILRSIEAGSQKVVYMLQ